MDIESWTRHGKEYLSSTGNRVSGLPGVYLTGSPVVFPNYKILDLIEQAGMQVMADDICTLERSFSGGIAFEDKSEYALLRALANRYHQGVTCPTFADNERRINAIFNGIGKTSVNGVIFHVLKGCHPYDMEAGLMETQLKKKNIRFLKIETDYVQEDEQNILTRLEAFRRTLKPVSRETNLLGESDGNRN